MSYKEIINEIKPIPYSKYKNISSNEKLAAYASNYLESNNVPLYFNYICIAAFKFFPDKFCCDAEFKEYPSVDRLNRTVLHMHTNKNQNNYLTGTVNNGFKLTELGRLVARQVSNEISMSAINESDKAPMVDLHKKGRIQEYERFVESELFTEYKNQKDINLNQLWKLYKVIPYSRTQMIKQDLKTIKDYAKEINDEACLDCINKLIEQL